MLGCAAEARHDYGVWGKIWPAAEVLGAYIAGRYSSSPSSPAKRNGDFNNYNFDWRGKRIIELGSGTGLVGYLVHAFHLPGCQVWVTDQDVMLPLMRENLALNFPLSPNSTSSTPSSDDGFCKVDELNWGEPLPPSIPPPDVLLLRRLRLPRISLPTTHRHDGRAVKAGYRNPVLLPEEEEGG